MNFPPFSHSVYAQFAKMAKEDMLFVTDVSGDELWQTYLASFPEGTNPVYRVRTEYDCSCCKSVIRHVGNVVALDKNYKFVTIWDSIKAKAAPEFHAVAKAMRQRVLQSTIVNVFFSPEQKFGQEHSFEHAADGGIVKWDHFHVTVPSKHMRKGSEIQTLRSVITSTHDVTFRGLTELTDSAIDTVTELIQQRALYRGNEFKTSVMKFAQMKHQYDALDAAVRDNFVWANANNQIGRIRNTAIGTLLIDLSNGVNITQAVASFESKVAPENYKRTTAVVTASMMASAKTELAELGLASALKRRYATASDISINDVLFVDRGIKAKLISDDLDELDSLVSTNKHSITKKTAQQLDKAQQVSIDQFINDILPTAESVEIMVESEHLKNLVSLIAPTDPAAERLFKWDNPYSWSYVGELADSAIKQRVKNAGGNVNGVLCFRLAWHNYDDLDIHVIDPVDEIAYFNRCNAVTGGQLDVDMNAGSGTSREPVENIFYPDRSRLKNGTYVVGVINFCRRDTTDGGFEVEVDMDGDTHTYTFANNPVNRQTIPVATVTYKDGAFSIVGNTVGTRHHKQKWGITPRTFAKVSLITTSPNYWGDNAVGNKHYFFMLDGCVNDEIARGFFNEFLRSELTPHRKAMELVGSSLLPAPASDQLSGIGFSSTRNNTVTCRVTGATTRIIKINF